MIADFARVANGKLDVIGGGWSMMNAQGPFGFFVAALFQIPWDQTNAKHRFRLELLDADGQGVPISERRDRPGRGRVRGWTPRRAAAGNAGRCAARRPVRSARARGRALRAAADDRRRDERGLVHSGFHCSGACRRLRHQLDAGGRCGLAPVPRSRRDVARAGAGRAGSGRRGRRPRGGGRTSASGS